MEAVLAVLLHADRGMMSDHYWPAVIDAEKSFEYKIARRILNQFHRARILPLVWLFATAEGGTNLQSISAQRATALLQ